MTEREKEEWRVECIGRWRNEEWNKLGEGGMESRINRQKEE